MYTVTGGSRRFQAEIVKIRARYLQHRLNDGVIGCVGIRSLGKVTIGSDERSTILSYFFQMSAGSSESSVLQLWHVLEKSISARSVSNDERAILSCSPTMAVRF